MTKEEAVSRLNEIKGNWDTEVAHSDADDVLCQLLISLGCQEVVDAWHEVDKWYA